MPLKELITDHPEALFLGCFVWVPIAVWVSQIVGWMIQGELDAAFGFVAIGTSVALGYFTMKPPTPGLGPLFFLAVISIMVIFPFAKVQINRRALVDIDVEKMHDAYEVLKLKPDNYMTYFKMGKILYESGHVEPGISVASQALAHMPDKVFVDEHRMVARWKRQNPQANPDASVICVECGTSNPPGTLYCSSCNGMYLAAIVRGRWVGKQFMKRVISAWAAGVIALIGIPLAAQLPPVAAIIVILAIIAGALVLIWQAFLATRGPAAA